MSVLSETFHGQATTGGKASDFFISAAVTGVVIVLPSAVRPVPAEGEEGGVELLDLGRLADLEELDLRRPLALPLDPGRVGLVGVFFRPPPFELGGVPDFLFGLLAFGLLGGGWARGALLDGVLDRLFLPELLDLLLALLTSLVALPAGLAARIPPAFFPFFPFFFPAFSPFLPFALALLFALVLLATLPVGLAVRASGLAARGRELAARGLPLPPAPPSPRMAFHQALSSGKLITPSPLASTSSRASSMMSSSISELRCLHSCLNSSWSMLPPPSCTRNRNRSGQHTSRLQRTVSAACRAH